jgi:hypothetical protein
MVALQMYPVYCAWCKGLIGESEVEHSHGICVSCKAIVLQERTAKKELQ